MTIPIEIRDLEKEDISNILRLANADFAIQKDFKYMVWQCFNSPLPRVIKIALCQNEIAGWFGLQERILSNGLLCGQLSYLFVSPHWRGKGVFRDLGQAVINSYKELDVLLVFSNDAAVKACQKSFGLKYVRSISMLKYRIGYQNLFIDYKSTRVNSFTVYHQTDFGLLERVHFQYSPDFLRWRFAQNPLYNYEKIETETGEYALVKLFVEPQSHYICGDIVYYRCNLNDQPSIARLIASCCSFLVEHRKVEIVTTWAPNHEPLVNVFRNMGFSEEKSGTHFLVRAMRPDVEYLEDYSHWIVMQSDATNY